MSTWARPGIGERTLDKSALVKHRFFGAATPNRPVDFIQNLTENIPKRYFIKGRPGTGKSTILKKLAAKAEAAGTDEKYASQIKDITERYSAKMAEATSYLALAKSLHDDLEKFYVAAMDFAKVEELQREIDAEIARIASF